MADLITRSVVTRSRGDVTVAGYDAPLFTTFSPPDLLDKHIQLGWEVHAKQLSHIPLTSHGSVNWIHFGGTFRGLGSDSSRTAGLWVGITSPLWIPGIS